MANYQKVIITQKGQALMTKMMAGVGNVQFLKILTSSQIYTMEQLEGLSSLENIKQTTLVSKVTRTSATAIKIEGAINNADLTAGYLCQTVGMTALDPDEGEILYGVTITSQADYIPPFNNVTMTGIKFELVLTVGNASNVTLEVNPAALVTVQQLNDAVELLRSEIGSSGGGSASIPLSPSEPENWKDGDWWFEELGEFEPAAMSVEVTTVPYDETRPFHLELGGETETMTKVTDNEATATADDLIIT